MQIQLLISIISEDKPGVVEAIANAVSTHKGNWLESQLAQLAGKFAGVISVSLPKDEQTALKNTLNELKKQNIHVVVDVNSAQKNQDSSGLTASFTVAGPDRTGIVKEISQAFALQHINVASLKTHISSMPYSGAPLFEAEGKLRIPENLDVSSLQDTLDDIADNLGVDFALNS